MVRPVIKLEHIISIDHQITYKSILQ